MFILTRNYLSMPTCFLVKLVMIVWTLLTVGLRLTLIFREVKEYFRFIGSLNEKHDQMFSLFVLKSMKHSANTHTDRVGLKTSEYPLSILLGGW